MQFAWHHQPSEQDGKLSLIHIPLDLFPYFVQPVLQLLLGEETPPQRSDRRDTSTLSGPNVRGKHRIGFANISITPVELSVVCPVQLVKTYFEPVLDSLDQATRNKVSISKDDFVAICVEGEGVMDAGQRMLELTGPLAMAGISIFFITTYWADFMLVPIKSKAQVAKALEKQGFAFASNAFTGGHHRNNPSTSSSNDLVPPSTPPPSSISELQARTFAGLERHGIVPTPNPNIRLISCAGANQGLDGLAYLKLGLIECIISRPAFFSVTLTDRDSASIMVEEHLIHLFKSDKALIGNTKDLLIPITLDLRNLPLESTGIVCGVAGRLVGGSISTISDAPPVIEMTYLSTARAGNVMVPEKDLERALEALK